MSYIPHCPSASAGVAKDRHNVRHLIACSGRLDLHCGRALIRLDVSSSTAIPKMNILALAKVHRFRLVWWKCKTASVTIEGIYLAFTALTLCARLDGLVARRELGAADFSTAKGRLGHAKTDSQSVAEVDLRRNGEVTGMAPLGTSRRSARCIWTSEGSGKIQVSTKRAESVSERHEFRASHPA